MKSDIIDQALFHGLEIVQPNYQNNIAYILFRLESTEIQITTGTKDGSYIVSAKSFASVLSGKYNIIIIIKF